MSDFYAGMMEVASNLLADKGQSVTLTHRSATYAPATGLTTVTETAEVGVGALFSARSRASNDREDGLKQVGSRRMALAVRGITSAPQAGDTVTALDENGASHVYSVLRCNSIAPAGVPVLYILELE